MEASKWRARIYSLGFSFDLSALKILDTKYDIPYTIFVMSKTKAGGSARNLKDSPGQRLGVKVFGGQVVRSGNVIVRQRGLSKLAGPGTKLAKDYTIFAIVDGRVAFKPVRKTRFSGKRVPRIQVEVRSK